MCRRRWAVVGGLSGLPIVGVVLGPDRELQRLHFVGLFGSPDEKLLRRQMGTHRSIPVIRGHDCGPYHELMLVVHQPRCPGRLWRATLQRHVRLQDL